MHTQTAPKRRYDQHATLARSMFGRTHDEAPRLGRRVGLPAFGPVGQVSDGALSVERIVSTPDLAKLAGTLAFLDEGAASPWGLRGTCHPVLSNLRSTGAKVAYALRENGLPVGFMVTGTDVDCHSDDGCLDFWYGVHGEFVYLAPQARGRGLAKVMLSVLSDQVGQDLAHVLGRLAALGFDGRFRASVDGVARSPEGAAFLNAASTELARRVGSFGRLPFAVSCEARAFVVTTALDDYRID